MSCPFKRRSVLRHLSGHPPHDWLRYPRLIPPIVCQDSNASLMTSIVAIHGLNGDPKDTWTDPKTGFFFLGTSFRSPLVPIYNRFNVREMSHMYTSLVLEQPRSPNSVLECFSCVATGYIYLRIYALASLSHVLKLYCPRI